MSLRPIFIFCVLTLMIFSFQGIGQTTYSSKWVIDRKTYFLSQQRDTIGRNYTIIFIGNVIFHSDLLTLEGMDSIIYNKRTKKLTVGRSKNGKTTLSKKIITTMLTPITEPSDSFNFEFLEYTIGDWTVYLR